MQSPNTRSKNKTPDLKTLIALLSICWVLIYFRCCIWSFPVNANLSKSTFYFAFESKSKIMRSLLNQSFFHILLQLEFQPWRVCQNLSSQFYSTQVLSDFFCTNIQYGPLSCKLELETAKKNKKYINKINITIIRQILITIIITIAIDTVSLNWSPICTTIHFPMNININ